MISDCTKAIELHPHYPKPVLRRAQAYEKTNKLDEALEDYKKLLELDPRNIEALNACQVSVYTDNACMLVGWLYFLSCAWRD